MRYSFFAIILIALLLTPPATCDKLSPLNTSWIASYTIDLNEPQTLTIGSTKIEATQFETGTRVRTWDGNTLSKFEIYHSSSDDFFYTDTEGNDARIFIEPADEKQTIRKVPGIEKQYRDKIEEVLYDAEYLEKHEHMTKDLIPVIISFDTTRLRVSSSVVHKQTAGSTDSSTTRAVVDQYRQSLAGELKEKGIMSFLRKNRPKSIVDDPLYIINGVSARVSPYKIEQLQNIPYIKRVSLDRKVTMTLHDSVGMINADRIWSTTDENGKPIIGAGMVVSVIDTGIDSTHPDFARCFVSDDQESTVMLDSLFHLVDHYGNRVMFEFDDIDTTDQEITLTESLTGNQYTMPYNGGETFGDAVFTFSGISFFMHVSESDESLILKFTLVCNESRIIGGYDFVNDDDDPSDDHGHGTHCAGIVGANGAVIGVAPGVDLLAYKVLDESGSGYTSDVIAGIERSVDPNNDGNFSDHADVISLSLGGGGNPDDEVSRAVDTAVKNDVVVVVSAGNSGPYPESIGSPGCARKALTVGAMCKPDQIGNNHYCDDAIASFSSRGPTSIGSIKPDVVAPGVMICSSQYEDAWDESRCTDSDHTAISGTSMAAPHVAGAAALLRQTYPDRNSEQIRSMLISTSTDLGFDPNTQGTGNIDMQHAINASLQVEPSSIAFGIIRSIAFNETFRISNMKDHEINVTLSLSEFTDENKNNYTLGSLDEDELQIDPEETADVLLLIDLDSQVEGIFYGYITMIAEGITYRVPITFMKYSKLTIRAESSAHTLTPDFMFHNDDMTMKGYASQGFDFEEDGTTFNVRTGNYTVFAFGDSEIRDLEYILVDRVEVTPWSHVNVTLHLEDARAYSIPARALDETELMLYEWQRGMYSYLDNERYVGYSFHAPRYGDRTVYISDKPANGADMDAIFKYSGIPSQIDTATDSWGKVISR